jgi:hypothetical protein
MLTAVAREAHAGSPELWRRYFAILVDGLASSRPAPSALAVPPPAPPTGR